MANKRSGKFIHLYVKLAEKKPFPKSDVHLSITDRSNDQVREDSLDPAHISQKLQRLSYITAEKMISLFKVILKIYRRT